MPSTTSSPMAASRPNRRCIPASTCYFFSSCRSLHDRHGPCPWPQHFICLMPDIMPIMPLPSEPMPIMPLPPAPIPILSAAGGGDGSDLRRFQISDHGIDRCRGVSSRSCYRDRSAHLADVPTGRSLALV